MHAVYNAILYIKCVITYCTYVQCMMLCTSVCLPQGTVAFVAFLVVRIFLLSRGKELTLQEAAHEKRALPHIWYVVVTHCMYRYSGVVMVNLLIYIYPNNKHYHHDNHATLHFYVSSDSNLEQYTYYVKASLLC